MGTIKKASALGAVLLAAALTVGIAAPAHAYPDNDPVIADTELYGSSTTPVGVGSTLGATNAWTVTEGFAFMGEAFGGDCCIIRLPNYDPTTYDPNTPGSSAIITSAVEQTFPTTEGAVYQLDYRYVGNGSFNVLIDGVSVQSFTADEYFGAHSFQFTAVGASTTLAFEYTDDAVSVPFGYDSRGGFDSVEAVQIECGDPNDGSSTPDCLPTPMIDIVIGAGAAVLAAGWGTVFYFRRRTRAAASELGAL